LPILSTLRIFSSVMPSFSAGSSGVGSRPISLSQDRVPVLDEIAEVAVFFVTDGRSTPPSQR
jgi:hypothetical protein